MDPGMHLRSGMEQEASTLIEEAGLWPQVVAYVLVGSRGPCQCARPTSDWDYIVLVRTGTLSGLSHRYLYLRGEHSDVGLYEVAYFEEQLG
jgi:hypothetical protein